jgi:protein O-mannosyl-transferase
MTRSAQQPPIHRRCPAGMYAILLIAVTAVYAPAIRYQFVAWDDDDLVAQNPLLHPPTLEHLKQFWIAPYAKLYTPVAYSAWWWLARVFGGPPNPAVFHAFNVLLHLAAAALVFSVLRQMIENDWAAFAGSMIFALHPLQVESVAWVSGMNTLLASVLSLAAIRLYLEYATDTSAARWPWYVAASIVFALALLAKPTAVITPLLVAMIDLTVTRRRISQIALSIILWLFASTSMIFITRHVQPISNLSQINLWQRPAIAADAALFYLRKIIWPARLTIDYVRTPQRILGNSHWIIAGIALTFIVAVLWITRRGSRRVLTAFGIFIVALLPTLGFVSFDFQRYSTVADRYVYLAMLGVAIAAASLLSPRKSPAIISFVVILLILSAARSEVQLQHWQNTNELAAYTLKLDPMSTVGNKILAAQYSRQEQWDQAIKCDNLALVRNPNDGDLHYNLANAYLNSQDFNDAVDEYEFSIPLLDFSPKLRAMNNLGIAYFHIGQTELAENEFMQILQIDPRNADARKNLGLVVLGVRNE